MERFRLSGRRRNAGLAVLGGHLLLGWLASTHNTAGDRPAARREPELEVSLIRSSPLPPVPPGASHRKDAATVPPASRVAIPPVGVPPSVTPEPGPASIDWDRAAAQAAAAAARESPAPKPDCDEKETPGSMRPRCSKPSHFEWHPDPKRVEFDGLIPYIRLGKRCVVGLGFFGCAVGPAPEANGHLLDEMNDPDRPRSSVPETPR